MSSGIRFVSFEVITPPTIQQTNKNISVFLIQNKKSSKSDNPINKIQSHLKTNYPSDIKLFKAFNDTDMVQLLNTAKTHEIFCVIQHDFEQKFEKMATKILSFAQKSHKNVHLLILLDNLQNKSMQTFFHPLVKIVTCEPQIVIANIENFMTETKQLKSMPSSSTLNDVEMGRFAENLQDSQFHLNTISHHQEDPQYVDNQVPGPDKYSPSKTQFDHKGKGASFSRTTKQTNVAAWRKSPCKQQSKEKLDLGHY